MKCKNCGGPLNEELACPWCKHIAPRAEQTHAHRFERRNTFTQRRGKDTDKVDVASWRCSCGRYFGSTVAWAVNCPSVEATAARCREEYLEHRVKIEALEAAIAHD